MEGITYRKSSKDDLLQIAELLEKFDLNTAGMETGDFMVAARGKKILGCARITEPFDNIIELSSVVVVDECRRQGIGKEIIKLLLATEKRRPVYLMCRRANQPFTKKAVSGKSTRIVCPRATAPNSKP